ncbi:hypothetical protein CEXT_578961 [Caerostris extrusa]|uniref:Uncharacterized protein n=1 Tax=Caerostris extrusa TaxID=172846 RepID=A0AAV4VC02_CAEEX|nr:hypothetical protein CEXT_578961 [Caerostris extrusa]
MRKRNEGWNSPDEATQVASSGIDPYIYSVLVEESRIDHETNKVIFLIIALLCRIPELLAATVHRSVPEKSMNGIGSGGSLSLCKELLDRNHGGLRRMDISDYCFIMSHLGVISCDRPSLGREKSMIRMEG